jgi:glycosyltransferase involved in cell wall biosynthesis
MQGLLYYRTHVDDPNNLGVVQKCRAYAKALQSHGIQVDVWMYQTAGVLKNGQLWYRPFIQPRKKTVGHLLLFYVLGDWQMARRIDFRQYDFILIRHMPTHPMFRWLLKVAKKQNPALTIILEIPTWPYDAEMNNGFARIQRWIDRRYRTSLYPWVDYVLNYYGTEQVIWKIPVIAVQNGIAVDEIPISGWIQRDPTQLNLLFVGNLQPWHGLDRVLKGMSVHLKQPNHATFSVRLDIVGLSPQQMHHWAAEIEHLGLQQSVFLHPPCEGAALHAFLEKADWGLGTLAIHRKGLKTDASLKHRLYCAVGLPFICSAADLDFEDGFPYVFRVPETDAPLDIVDLYQKRAQLQTAHPDYAAEMRQYAAQKLDWKQKVLPVLQVLGHAPW